jgi:tRNA-specific 2-thiouridylase
VSDVDDARRVADHLGIEHHVFNFGHEFTQFVVDPYVADHAAGRTPNPCVECNRHLKFDRLLRRADALGFDGLASGHHARIVPDADGTLHVARGRDHRKDQSYVLHMLGPTELGRILLPVGDLTKSEVREHARRLGLRTAEKAESQDVCFITSTDGRARFLERRSPLTPGTVRNRDGAEVGHVPAVELVTIGQRKGLGIGGGRPPQYALKVDPATATVVVGDKPDLRVGEQPVEDLRWTHRPHPGTVHVQCSAHGAAEPATVAPDDEGGWTVRWVQEQPRVAPGQSLVLYAGALVVGGGAGGLARLG